ncbi:MAG: RSP_7527 family protein [Magnetospiraceae bacterium]
MMTNEYPFGAYRIPSEHDIHAHIAAGRRLQAEAFSHGVRTALRWIGSLFHRATDKATDGLTPAAR